MSESATIYRISKNTFDKLNALTNIKRFDISSAKSYVMFEGSFMGLEYVLSKGQEPEATELLHEIFDPKETLGSQESVSLTPEEQFELYESGGLIPYLDVTKVYEINQLLNKISDAHIHANYEPSELNDNGIYPQVWHNNNSTDQVFNEQQLQQDFAGLRSIFSQAALEEDYLLVFIG